MAEHLSVFVIMMDCPVLRKAVPGLIQRGANSHLLKWK
jgi:hypothetical protein